MKNKLLNVEELMSCLRIGRTALWNLTKTGQLRVTRIGNRLFVTESELERFIAAATSGEAEV